MCFEGKKVLSDKVLVFLLLLQEKYYTLFQDISLCIVVSIQFVLCFHDYGVSCTVNF